MYGASRRGASETVTRVRDKAWALAALTSLASLAVLNRRLREISHWQTARKEMVQGSRNS